MCSKNDWDMIYRVGKVIWLVYFGLFLFAAIIFFVRGTDVFEENPKFVRIFSLSGALLGLHIAVFSERYAKYYTDWYERFLRNKPKIIQAWLCIHKSYSYNRFMCRLFGIFFMLVSGLIFISTF